MFSSRGNSCQEINKVYLTVEFSYWLKFYEQEKKKLLTFTSKREKFNTKAWTRPEHELREWKGYITCTIGADLSVPHRYLKTHKSDQQAEISRTPFRTRPCTTSRSNALLVISLISACAINLELNFSPFALFNMSIKFSICWWGFISDLCSFKGFRIITKVFRGRPGL